MSNSLTHFDSCVSQYNYVATGLFIIYNFNSVQVSFLRCCSQHHFSVYGCMFAVTFNKGIS